MGSHPYADNLAHLLEQDPCKSTGHAAIETLLARLKSSKGKYV